MAQEMVNILGLLLNIIYVSIAEVKDIGTCSNVQIVSRDSRGSGNPKLSFSPVLEQTFFIYDPSITSCGTQNECKHKITEMVETYKHNSGRNTTPFSFLIAEDGTIYEDLGWKTLQFNSDNKLLDSSLAVAFIGEGSINNKERNKKSVDAARALMLCGMYENYFTPYHKLLWFTDIPKEDCPGAMLYQIIHTWPKYDSTKYESNDCEHQNSPKMKH